MSTLKLSLLVFVVSTFLANALSAQTTLNRALATTDFNDLDHAIDPRGYGSAALTVVKADLFESLVNSDYYGVLRNRLAADWSMSDDRMTMYITIRDDIVWSDGVPLTAQDFVFAFWRRFPDIRSPDSNRNYIVGGADFEGDRRGFRAEGDHLIVIELTEPDALGPRDFRRLPYAPLPSHVAPDAETLWSDWPERPVVGPYKLVEIDRETSIITLERNPLWFDDVTPAYETVRIHFAPWEEIAPRILENRYDVVETAPLGQSQILIDAGYSFAPEASWRLFYVALNSQSDTLSDVRVRRALSLAVNRPELIIRATEPALATPSENAAPTALTGWKPRIKSYEDAFAEATQLMRDAGYDEENRLELSISLRPTIENQRVSRVVSEYWSNIFVDAVLDEQDISNSEHRAQLRAGEFEVAMLTYRTDSLVAMRHFRQCERVSYLCGFSDSPEIARLFEESKLETDIEYQIGLAAELDQVIYEEVPFISLYHRLRTSYYDAEDVSVSVDLFELHGTKSFVFSPHD